MTISISKLIVSTCTLVALLNTASTQQVAANPSSASKCDIWGENNGYGPHRRVDGATGGNTVTVAGGAYTPGTAITLTFATAGTFQGFQVLAIDANQRRVGTFSSTGLNSENGDGPLVGDQGCGSNDENKPWVTGSTFSHKSQTPKPVNMQLKWTPDPTAAGTVTFVTTIMPQKGEFYKAATATIARSATAPPPKSYAPVAEVIVAPPVGGAPIAQPIQTVPTDGKLTTIGLGTSQVFNPYDNNLMQQGIEAAAAKKLQNEALIAAAEAANAAAKAGAGIGGVIADQTNSKYGKFEGAGFSSTPSGSAIFNPASVMHKSSAVPAAAAAATLLTAVSIVASALLL